jgi:hypothetical protein
MWPAAQAGRVGLPRGTIASGRQISVGRDAMSGGPANKRLITIFDLTRRTHRCYLFGAWLLCLRSPPPTLVDRYPASGRPAVDEQGRFFLTRRRAWAGFDRKRSSEPIITGQTTTRAGPTPGGAMTYSGVAS